MINRYASLRQGLVGAWCPSVQRCGSGFTLPDLSGYGNNGSLVNMDPGTDWVASRSGLAIDFDGSNDYVELQNNPSVNNGVTVSLWAKWASTGSNIYYPNMFIKSAASTWSSPYCDYMLRLEGNAKKLNCAVGDAGNSASILNGTTTITVDNIWRHCCFTYDLQTMRIFLDGKDDGSKSRIGTIPSSTFPTYIGARQGFGEWFNGQLDDIRIYNRALTPSEVQLLYTGGRGVGLAPERIKHRRKTTAAAFKAAWARRQQHIGSGVY